MDKLSKLLEQIKEHKKKYEITENSSTAAKLRHRIMHERHTDNEWLALQEELREYIASNPPKDELDELQGCGEALSMICCGIREKRR